MSKQRRWLEIGICLHQWQHQDISPGKILHPPIEAGCKADCWGNSTIAISSHFHRHACALCSGRIIWAGCCRHQQLFSLWSDYSKRCVKVEPILGLLTHIRITSKRGSVIASSRDQASDKGSLFCGAIAVVWGLAVACGSSAHTGFCYCCVHFFVSCPVAASHLSLSSC